jgi:hypothetical protein
MCPIQLAHNLTKSDCTKKGQRQSPKTYPLTTKNNRQKTKGQTTTSQQGDKRRSTYSIAPTKNNCQKQLVQDLKFATKFKTKLLL